MEQKDGDQRGRKDPAPAIRAGGDIVPQSVAWFAPRVAGAFSGVTVWVLRMQAGSCGSRVEPVAVGRRPVVGHSDTRSIGLRGVHESYIRDGGRNSSDLKRTNANN